MNRFRRIGYWYWLAMSILLVGEIAGCPYTPSFFIGLGVAQSVHYFARTWSLTAFPVQVRIAYLGMLLAGLWPPLAPLHWIQLAGTCALLVFDYCPLARLLSLMPWYRRNPLTLQLIWRTFVSPPVKDSFMNAQTWQPLPASLPASARSAAPTPRS